MKAVILAGGLGARLRPFTEVIPKPLLPLGENSVMEVQIRALREHGFTDIFVATNYMAEYVEAFLGDGSRYGVRLRFSKEGKPLGTCGPLALLRDEITESFLLVNGDILTKLDFKAFFDFAQASNSVLTVATKTIITPFRFGNVMADENDHITFIEEKPDLKFEILAGVYGMRPEIFSWIPDNTLLDMDALIQTLLKEKQQVSRYQVREYWLDIGQVGDYSEASDAYNEHFRAGVRQA